MKTVYLMGDFGFEITEKSFADKVDLNSTEKLRIVIDSPGGRVEPAIKIYNMIKAYKGEIEIILGAMVASAASYVAMAVPKANRKAFKNSSMMIHEASSGGYGKASEFKTMYERLTGINKIIAEAYSEGMGIKIDEALNMMKEDFYFTGWEKLTEHNIIDDIIDPADVKPPNKEDFPPDFFDLFFMSLEKEPDSNVIKEKMYQAEARANENKVEAALDLEKAAAYLKPDGDTQTNETQTDGTQQTTPLETSGENKITTEVNKMSLQDYLNSHPEHKAEFDQQIETAKNSGAEKANADTVAVIAERERIAEIISLSGVSINDTIAQAIDKGVEASDYAKAELLAQKEKRTGINKPIFGTLAAKQTPGEEDTASTAEVIAGMGMSDEDFQKRLKDGSAMNKNRRLV